MSKENPFNREFQKYQHATRSRIAKLTERKKVYNGTVKVGRNLAK